MGQNTTVLSMRSRGGSRHDTILPTIRSRHPGADCHAFYLGCYCGRGSAGFSGQGGQCQTDGLHAGIRGRRHDRRKLLVSAGAGHRDGRADGSDSLADRRNRFHGGRSFHEIDRPLAAPPSPRPGHGSKRGDQDLLAAFHTAGSCHYPA